MLVGVMAVLALVSVLATVLVGMTITALGVSSSFRENLDKTSASDSALEELVHDLQKTVEAAGQDCYGATDQGSGHDPAYLKTISFPNGDSVDVIVDCNTTGPLTPARDITLEAFAGGDTQPSAKARIEIIDEVGGLSRPGNEVRICDWQVGQNVKSTVAPCP